MSATTINTPLACGSGINGQDHSQATHSADSATSVYWSQLLTTWQQSIASTSTSSSAHHTKLDAIIDYVLAANDLHDSKTDSTPWLGSYPRLSIVEKVLGLHEEEANIILGLCPSIECPIRFVSWDSPSPPFIDSSFRAFLTGSLGGEFEGSYLKDTNKIHKNLATFYIRSFFNPVLDRTLDGQAIKAYLGLAWRDHIARSDGFNDPEVSRMIRQLDLSSWFDWVLAEGWKTGMDDTQAEYIQINAIEVISKFAVQFTQVPDSHHGANTKALTEDIKNFLTRNYVEDLDDEAQPLTNAQLKVQAERKQLPARYISVSFYLNRLHWADRNLLDGNSLWLPPHVRLTRRQLLALLGVYPLEVVDDAQMESAYELAEKDPSVPLKVSVMRHELDIYPGLRIPEDPRMDRIFECASVFDVWVSGANTSRAYTWRGRKETHEDLAVCCLMVLLKWDKSSFDKIKILDYAKYAWSYHLSFSTPTTQLITLLEKYTAVPFLDRSALYADYCYHPLLVIGWLEEAYWSFPASIMEPLLTRWRHIFAATANQKRVTSDLADQHVDHVSASDTSTSSAESTSGVPQGVDRTKRRERISPYARVKNKKG